MAGVLHKDEEPAQGSAEDPELVKGRWKYARPKSSYPRIPRLHERVVLLRADVDNAVPEGDKLRQEGEDRLEFVQGFMLIMSNEKHEAIIDT